jgi:hypothetical protein
LYRILNEVNNGAQNAARGARADEGVRATSLEEAPRATLNERLASKLIQLQLLSGREYLKKGGLSVRSECMALCSQGADGNRRFVDAGSIVILDSFAKIRPGGLQS